MGSLLAIYLRKYHHNITVFDRRPDIRGIQFSGRSINLAMSNRGWTALEEVGIADEIRKIGIPLDKRAMHVIGEEEYYQKYGKDGEAIWSISRGVLNKRMIDLAETAGVAFRFEEKVWDIDLAEAKIYTGESEKSEWKEYQYDMVFGCDGFPESIHSVLSVIGAAPELSGIEFKAFNNRYDPIPLSVNIGDEFCEIDDFWCRVSVVNDRMHLEIYLENAPKVLDMDPRVEAVMIYLDALIGEYELMTRVWALDWFEIPASPEDYGLTRLVDLRDYFDEIKQGASPIGITLH